jgi:hypothetical protein
VRSPQSLAVAVVLLAGCDPLLGLTLVGSNDGGSSMGRDGQLDGVPDALGMPINGVMLHVPFDVLLGSGSGPKCTPDAADRHVLTCYPETGEISLETPGIVGSGALDFDNGAFMQTDESADFTSPSFSVSIWIDFEQSTGAVAKSCVVEKAYSANITPPDDAASWQICLTDTTQGYAGGDTGDAWSIAINDDGTLATGWHMVSLTFDSPSSQAVLYVDAMSVGSSAASIAFDMNPVAIATAFGVTGQDSYSGAIDDLWIYNRVIAPSEVLALYLMMNVSPGIRGDAQIARY